MTHHQALSKQLLFDKKQKKSDMPKRQENEKIIPTVYVDSESEITVNFDKEAHQDHGKKAKLIRQSLSCTCQVVIIKCAACGVVVSVKLNRKLISYCEHEHSDINKQLAVATLRPENANSPYTPTHLKPITDQKWPGEHLGQLNAQTLFIRFSKSESKKKQ